MRSLRYALSQGGLTHTCQGKSAFAQVMPGELTMRCDDGSLVWNEEGGAPVPHPSMTPLVQLTASPKATRVASLHAPPSTPWAD